MTTISQKKTVGHDAVVTELLVCSSFRTSDRRELKSFVEKNEHFVIFITLIAIYLQLV